MKQYLGIVFLVLLFFLVIHLITSDKDKIVEGIVNNCDTGTECRTLVSPDCGAVTTRDECGLSGSGAQGSYAYDFHNPRNCIWEGGGAQVCSMVGNGSTTPTDDMCSNAVGSIIDLSDPSSCVPCSTDPNATGYTSNGIDTCTITGCVDGYSIDATNNACVLEDVNCTGYWSACGTSCRKQYIISTAQSGNGVACTQLGGATRTCNPGEGACISQVVEVRTDCTVADFNGKGEYNCDSVNGLVSGEKINDDVSACTCACSDGYRLGIVSQGEQGCVVESDYMGNFRCFDSCETGHRASYTIFSQHVRAGDITSALQTVCEFVDSVNDVNGGCGIGCTVGGGGSPQSETTLNNWSDSMRRNHGCDGSNVESNVEWNVESNDEYYISQLYDLREIISLCMLFDIYGFTYSSFSQLQEDQRERFYTDEGIMNKNYLKNQLIVKLDETCPEGVLHTDCINEILQRPSLRGERADGRPMDFNDVDELLNILFKSVYKLRRRGSASTGLPTAVDSFQKISNFVEIFENKDEYGEEYQEYVDKILDEAGKSSIPYLNEISVTRVGETWDAKDRLGPPRSGADTVVGTELDDAMEDGLSEGAYILTNKVYNQYRPVWNVKALLCRDDNSDHGELPFHTPEHCNNQYCVGNVDLTKDHICPRLKYLGSADKIEGSTDDECCDISFFENIWFTIQDLFD
jgi:hypothetical protein